MVTRSIVKKFLPKHIHQKLRNQREKLRLRFALLFINRPDIYNMDTQERVGVIFKVDTHLSFDERFILYSFVRGLRPNNILEIGCLHGASIAIIAAALEDVGQGKIVGLDSNLDITYPEKLFFGRFQMVNMPSPEGVKKACEIAGHPFDMVHFDSIVTHDQMKLDIEACLPHISDPSYLLINNSVHYGVNQAIQEIIDSNANLYDCGFISATARVLESEIAHGTLRLLRFSSNRVSDPQSIIGAAFEREDKPVPSYDPELINHDPWYCRTISPCPRCRRYLNYNSEKKDTK